MTPASLLNSSYSTQLWETDSMLGKLFLCPHSAKEEPAQCHLPKSMWTRPLSPTGSAGQRCISSVFLFSAYFSRDLSFKTHNNIAQSCLFYVQQSRKHKRQNMSIYFSRVVIKWSVFSCSWTCFMRKLCTRWSTGWECLHPNKWKVTKSCLLTFLRYLSIYLSTISFFTFPPRTD